MNFTVEMTRDGKAVKRTEVQAGSDVEAAKAWGPVKAGLGREPPGGDFIRVTHQASGRTSWFEAV
jgi:hypothetical protein